jgi:hypothetical protein
MGTNYCDIQNHCKLLKNMISQYEKVVNQNRQLQKQLLELTTTDIPTRNNVLKSISGGLYEQ